MRVNEKNGGCRLIINGISGRRTTQSLRVADNEEIAADGRAEIARFRKRHVKRAAVAIAEGGGATLRLIEYELRGVFH